MEHKPGHTSIQLKQFTVAKCRQYRCLAPVDNYSVLSVTYVLTRKGALFQLTILPFDYLVLDIHFVCWSGPFTNLWLIQRRLWYSQRNTAIFTALTFEQLNLHIKWPSVKWTHMHTFEVLILLNDRYAFLLKFPRRICKSIDTYSSPLSPVLVKRFCLSRLTH